MHVTHHWKRFMLEGVGVSVQLDHQRDRGNQDRAQVLWSALRSPGDCQEATPSKETSLHLRLRPPRYPAESPEVAWSFLDEEKHLFDPCAFSSPRL